MRKFLRLREMSEEERGLLARASLLLPLVSTSLKVAGFRRTYRWLDRPEVGDTVLISDAEVKQTGDTVNRAVRNIPIYRATCLSRSMVLWHLLRKRGAPAKLRIGVRSEKGEFKAHAWVEREGQVINDKPDIAQDYTPVEFPLSFIQGR